jgi:PAS domain S-box-containing protein
MKYVRVLWTSALVALLAGLPAAAGPDAPAARRRFVYAGDAHFAPFDTTDAAGGATGFNVELVRALARDAGVEIEIRLGAWNQARADLDAGRVDLVSLTYSDERVKVYQWLAQTWTVHQVVVFPAGRAGYPHDTSGLARETIAVQERSAVGELLFALPGPRPSLATVATQAEALRLLKRGIATGVGGNSLTLRTAAAQEGLYDLVELPLQAVPYGLMAKKGRDAELAWVATSMARLRQAGTVEALAERFLAVPTRAFTWADYAGFAVWLIGIVGAVLAGAALWNRSLRREVALRTEDLRQRGRILEAVAYCSGRFLAPGRWDERVPDALARLGQAVDVSRASIYRNETAADGTRLGSLWQEWVAPGVVPHAGNPSFQSVPWQAAGFGRWEALLAKGEPVVGVVGTQPEGATPLLQSTDARSVLLVPIFAEGRWWGHLGFGEARSDRVWSAVELETLRVAASILGAALERETVVEALRVSEKKFRNIFDFSPIGIWQAQPDGTIITANNASAQILGYQSGAEVVGLNSARDVFAHAGQRERIVEQYADQNQVANLEILLKRKDGTRFWAEGASHVVRDPAGRALYYESFVQDISARRSTEDALRSSEERYRLLFDGNPLPMFVYDLETLRLLAANEAAVRQYGYAREELLRLSLVDLTPQDEILERFLATRFDPRPDLVHVGLRQQLRKDGSTIEIDLTSLAISFAGRNARMALARDVTVERQAALDRERLQAVIERAAAEWQRTVDAVDTCVLVLDREWRVKRINRATRDLLGRDYAETLDVRIHELSPGEPWRTAARLVETVRSQGAQATAQAAEPGVGRTWDVTAYLAAETQVDEERTILVLRDITHLVALQASLRRSETMSAMGSLVAGVAHEVRNPLFSISATVDALESEMQGRQEYAEYTALLRGQVARLTQLTRDLLDFGKPPVLAPTPVHPREVLRRALRTCAPLARERGVTVADDLSAAVPPLAVDLSRMEQVFENLIANAIQHATRGGCVHVSARLAEGATRIELDVEDDGAGLAADEIPHVFEPFYSRRKGGTGLGLSIVQRIVEAHGGRVTAANRPTRGAVFTVSLPVGQAAAEASGG